MGRISSSVGILSGFPIDDTVNQLMELASIPRKRLEGKTNELTQRQDLLSQLTSKLIGVQFSIRKFGESSLYNARKTTSSAPEFLSASAAAGSTVGSHSVVPLRLAATHQMLGSRVAARNASLAAGSFVIRHGSAAGDPIALSALNSGLGVSRGSIEIVNRAGESAIVDLTAVSSVDEAAAAINKAGVDVTASFDGDRFVLTDASGGAGSLQVFEVNGGDVAAGLGLAGINAAADSAQGEDVLALHDQTALASLNDGLGVRTLAASPELQFVFSDGSGPLDVNVHIDGGETLTLGDVVRQLNEADPARLQASISADGDHLVLNDLTGGGGSFAVRELGESGTLVDLGFIAEGESEITTTSGQLTSRRLQAGLQDVLLSTLGGSAGLGDLGSIQITNRNGVGTTVNLSTAETLGEVIAAINASGAGVTASVAHGRDGVAITDSSGGVGDLTISSVADGFDTAEALGIASTATLGEAIEGADLQRRRVNAGSALDLLALDGSVGSGIIQIIDSSGASAQINLDKLNVETVGDLIDAVNAAGISVTASVNAAGDGIQLLDDADGSGTLTIKDIEGEAASELRLTGAVATQTGAGGPEQVVQGGLSQTITIEEGDTLDDVAEAIEGALPGFTAAIAQDGSGARLILTAGKSGAASAFRVDDADSPISFQQTVRGRDALLIYGASSASDPGGVLLTSSTNRFDESVDGLDFDLKRASTEGVTVDIDADVDAAVANFSALVEAVNDSVTFLAENQKIDTTDRLKSGLLRGVVEASSALQSLQRAFQPTVVRAFSDGIDSITELGLKQNSDGTLTFDEATFRSAYEADPEAVREFLDKPDTGFVDRVDAALTTYVGAVSDGSAKAIEGVLLFGIQSLDRRIQTNKSRLDNMDVSLERQRARLTAKFQRMETAIAQMQNSLSSLQGLAALPPITSSNSN